MCGAADPFEAREIEGRAFAFQQLRIDEARIESADGEAVGTRGVKRVGADDMPGARHVFHEDARARQMFLHIAGDEPRIGVVIAAGTGRHDVSEGAPVIERQIRDARRRWCIGGRALSRPFTCHQHASGNYE